MDVLSHPAAIIGGPKLTISLSKLTTLKRDGICHRVFLCRYGSIPTLVNPTLVNPAPEIVAR